MEKETIDSYMREFEELGDEIEKARSRGDYSYVNDCLDRSCYLVLQILVEAGKNISELEEIGLTSNEEILSLRERYAKVSSKIKKAQKMMQENGLTNAPTE